eukprot:357498-Chlamydomonas_euryale.AAC.2
MRKKVVRKGEGAYVYCCSEGTCRVKSGSEGSQGRSAGTGSCKCWGELGEGREGGRRQRALLFRGRVWMVGDGMGRSQRGEGGRREKEGGKGGKEWEEGAGGKGAGGGGSQRAMLSRGSVYAPISPKS